MPYATISHLESLNSQREYTAVTEPSLTDAIDLLGQTAAKLDGLLKARGYLLPVPTGATAALPLLTHFNAVGAWAYVERSAPASPHKDEAWKMWMECLKELRDGEVDLGGPGGIPVDRGEGFPRGAFQPSAFFFVDMAL